MRSFQIQDHRDFMKKLLMTETFDAFQLVEASITTFVSFHIDGSFHADYFGTQEESSPSPEKNSLVLWKRVRPFFFELTRGKHTPLSFRIVFRLAPHNTEKLLRQAGENLNPEDINGLFLNIRFDGNELCCISGTSTRVFTLDKTLDLTWDSMLDRFFRKNQIPCIS